MIAIASSPVLREAPLPGWVPIAATVLWFVVIFALMVNRDRLNAWYRYFAERRQSRRWQDAGNVERRTIQRPGRWS